MKKTRIDRLLVERGLADSREKARALIMAGDVLVEDQPVLKAGAGVDAGARLRLRRPPHPYVGRGGVKLRGALDAFGIDVAGRISADIGASTGGFTDCLLRAGARRVYAIDVDTDQLDWRLRQDLRVRTVCINARHLDRSALPEAVDLVTVDVSFISVAKILPGVVEILGPGGNALILVKPQFEVGRKKVGKGGIVGDPGLHREAVGGIVQEALRLGFEHRGASPAAITGKQGNQEFFIWLRRS